MYLLDTNVISELRKYDNGKINDNVKAWFATISPKQTYISVVTLSEVEYGILQLERRDIRQAQNLRRWFIEWLLPEYQDRILVIDDVVAMINASLHVPDKMPINDAYICATALVHELTLVTRNSKDFIQTPVNLINPFTYKSQPS